MPGEKHAYRSVQPCTCGINGLHRKSTRPRRALGVEATYGLGTENANLPGFVVLISSGVQPNGGTSSFGSGFLPSVYQGVQCRSKGDPVLCVKPRRYGSTAARKASML